MAKVSRQPEPEVYRYRAYGLELLSSFPLHCPEGDCLKKPQISFYLRSEEWFYRYQKSDNKISSWYIYKKLQNGDVYLEWEEHYCFLIQDHGTSVKVGVLSSPHELDSLSWYLLGPVLSHCMLLQNLETLHGTCVINGEDAVVFLGDSGTGKSTLSGNFIAHEWQLVTDDMLVLRKKDNTYVTQPGLPRIKLFPEICEKLDWDISGISMNRFTEKKIFPMDVLDSSEIKLGSFILLNRSLEYRSVGLESISGADAITVILSNCYNTRVCSKERLKSLLAYSAEIAARVPVYRLSYFDCFAQWNEIEELVKTSLSGAEV